MAGLVPAIHDLLFSREDVDARDKPGHDGVLSERLVLPLTSLRGVRPMLGECARAATVEEARFRVDYPNSVPRRVKVIALDRPAEDLVRRLAQKKWNCATFMTTAAEETSRSVRDWLSTLAGEAVNLLDQIGSADLVVTVSTAGESADDAAIVADACAIHRVMLTSLLIDRASASEPVLLETMMPLRAHAAMLVVAKGEEYVEAMLTALRA